MERTILHADFNNFYASVECMLNALRLLTTQESGYTHLGGLVGAISSF